MLSLAILYMAEINPDIVLGITQIQIAVLVLIQSIGAFPLMASAGIPGFLMLSCLMSILGFLFTCFCIRETMGLTDKQKKQLYRPSHLRDDDLSSDEATESPVVGSERESVITDNTRAHLLNKTNSNTFTEVTQS